jgi:hypothetical protein
MTFFNFEVDERGRQHFQVSERWWYFLAATIPLTAVVFAVWIVWQRIRLQQFREEDVKAKLREERLEPPVYGHEFDEDDLETPVRPQEKQGGQTEMALLRFLKRRKGSKDPAQMLA